MTRSLALGMIALAATAAAPATPDGAWITLLRGNFERALDEATAALPDGPDRARAALVAAEAGRRTDGGAPELPPGVLQDLAAAKVAHLARDYAAAERGLRAARSRFAARGDSASTLTCDEQLAHVLQDAGRFEAAAELHEDVYRRATAAGDEPIRVSSGYGLAYTHLNRGEIEAARRFAEEALATAEALDLPLFAGHLEALLGTVCRFDLDLKGTSRHLERAAAAYARARRKELQASSLRRLAASAAECGQLPFALQKLSEARALALEVGDVREASFCLEHQATANHAVGRLDLAVDQWTRALEEGGSLWPPEWRVAALLNLGRARLERGDLAGALATYHRARTELEGSHSPLALPEVLTRIAGCLRLQGEPAAAHAKLDRAIRVARGVNLPLAEAEALAERGRVFLDVGDPDAARTAFAEAGRLVAGHGFADPEAEILLGRARAEAAADRPAAALAWLERAMDAADDRRGATREVEALQVGVFARSHPVHELAMDVLAALHRAEPRAGHDRRAFRVMQRAKARSFLDLLGDAGGAARILAVPEGVLDSVRTALAPNELLLEYFLGDTASYVACVTREDFTLRALPPRRRIENRVRAVLPLLEDYNLLGADPTYLRGPLAELSRTLLGGIPLDGVTALEVAPDGILHFLPFEALLAEDPGDAARFSAMPWLVNRLDVGYAPSAASLARLRSRPRPGTTAGVLAIGDPLLEADHAAAWLFDPSPAGRWRPLPFAAAEMNAATACFAPSSAKPFTGAKATLTTLAERCRSARYIHLATHGFFNETRPRFSGLVLSRGGDVLDDGYLQLDEILALPLACDQVTLSACSTARGEQITGEGVVGLTRAFLHAGARSVVAALWEVSGRETADLMADLYAELASAPEPDRRHALAVAKRRQIARVSDGSADPAHPFFWAAFVLIGAPR